MKRYKIAFLSINDPKDKRSWSGTTYYIGDTLEKFIGEVDFIGPVILPSYIKSIFNFKAKFIRLFFKKEYASKYSLLLSFYAARYFKKKLKNKEFDFIVAPAASAEIAFLDTKVPIYYISDTTFKLIVNFYSDDFSNLFFISKIEGNILEKRALRKSEKIIYPSHWAAESAKNHYNIPSSNLIIMPLGANMDSIPDKNIILKKHSNTKLTLLFLAVEWRRKGGEIAFQSLLYLQSLGIKVELIVCGCIPPQQYSNPDLRIIPFLNKNNKTEYDKFVNILSLSHFLILPTRADCSLLVAEEANAYGVPAITTITGGVTDIVKDGINGYCLPLEDKGEKYGELIHQIFSDEIRYKELVASSRRRFEEKLNWPVWAESFRKVIS